MRHALFAVVAFALATPALAQENTASVEPARAAIANEGAARLTIGVGVGWLPDYEGSDDSRFSPIPAANGTIAGMSFTVLGNRASLDLIPNVADRDWDFQFGPVAAVNLNRTNRDAIEDRRVRALGEIDTAVEVGGYVGIGKTGLITSDYDKLSVSLSYRHDVTKIHRTGIWNPSINYTTPLSTKALVGIFASAEFVEDRYARRYFGVTPTGSVASGLPAYRPEGGQKDITFGSLFTYALTGDLTKGMALVAGGTYRKLLGDFADSPIVSIAGSRHQWTLGAGLALTF